MDWTVKERADANHNPQVVVNGRPGKAPLEIDATVGVPHTLDASASADPDGDALTFTWFFYSEAGTGIPGQPVFASGRAPTDPGRNEGQGEIPSAPEGGPREPPVRVTLQDADTPRVTVVPKVPGTAHVILAVSDDGSPRLTSYRRVMLTIAPPPP
jgi:hypothetical protein